MTMFLIFYTDISPRTTQPTPVWVKMLAFRPKHPKRAIYTLKPLILQFTPLSEKTSIPVTFIWESLPGDTYM